MSVNLQFADGRAAHILASDSAARWSRGVMLLGDGAKPEAGVLRVGDETFQWIGSDGAMLDAGRAARKRGTKAASPGASAGRSVLAEMIGVQLKELPRAWHPPSRPWTARVCWRSPVRCC